jgi:hypothetical protein
MLSARMDSVKAESGASECGKCASESKSSITSIDAVFDGLFGPLEDQQPTNAPITSKGQHIENQDYRNMPIRELLCNPECRKLPGLFSTLIHPSSTIIELEMKEHPKNPFDIILCGLKPRYLNAHAGQVMPLEVYCPECRREHAPSPKLVGMPCSDFTCPGYLLADYECSRIQRHRDAALAAHCIMPDGPGIRHVRDDVWDIILWRPLNACEMELRVESKGWVHIGWNELVSEDREVMEEFMYVHPMMPYRVYCRFKGLWNLSTTDGVDYWYRENIHWARGRVQGLITQALTELDLARRNMDIPEFDWKKSLKTYFYCQELGIAHLRFLMRAVQSTDPEENAASKTSTPATPNESSSESESEQEYFNLQEAALIALPGLEHILRDPDGEYDDESTSVLLDYSDQLPGLKRQVSHDKYSAQSDIGNRDSKTESFKWANKTETVVDNVQAEFRPKNTLKKQDRFA